MQLSYAVGVDGLTLSSKPSAVIALDGLKPYYCNKCVIATLIQILEYCVCQHYRSRDDTEAQRLDHLRSGRYKMVSEHMLTVGRDPRNWQAHRKDFP